MREHGSECVCVFGFIGTHLSINHIKAFQNFIFHLTLTDNLNHRNNPLRTGFSDIYLNMFESSPYEISISLRIQFLYYLNETLVLICFSP